MKDGVAPGKLEEILGRLDSCCQKLWDEDRTSAVQVQVAIEEAKLELKRLERLALSLEEQIPEERRLGRVEVERRFQERVAELEVRLKQADEISSGLKEALAQERARVEKLFSENQTREEELNRFKEKELKAEVDRDAARAKKMEQFAGNIEAHSADLEKLWSERQQHLEGDFKKRNTDLEKRYETLLKDRPLQVTVLLYGAIAVGVMYALHVGWLPRPA